MAIIRTGFSAEPESFWTAPFLGFAGKGGCFWIFLHAGVHTPVPAFRLVDPTALFWTSCAVLNRKTLLASFALLCFLAEAVAIMLVLV